MRMERGTRTGTKHISMPMFVMLRRFTIPMTMLAEYQVAGIKPPTDVVVSVAVLCMGAMIAVKDFQTELWVVSGACPPVRAPSRVVVRLTVAQLARLFSHATALQVGMILLANACQGLTSVVSKIKMDTKEVSSVASRGPALPPSRGS